MKDTLNHLEKKVLNGLLKKGYALSSCSCRDCVLVDSDWENLSYAMFKLEDVYMHT